MHRLLLLLLLTLTSWAYAKEPPALLLATTFNNAIDVRDYWVSEKLDGVRAYWDGKTFTSRSGIKINAPTWFTDALPTTALDGELWLAHGQFEKTVSIVRKLTPIDSEWQNIRYAVFELPNGQGNFSERIATLEELIQKHPSPHLILIPQHSVSDVNALHDWLADVVAEGGEGLMLHRKEALYSTGRNGDLIKLKPYLDAEAIVVGYRKGKGKYQGLIGALVVRNTDRKEFAIGSGLTDEMRQKPPEIGSVITYQYDGLTRKGLPRHARFLRVRNEP